MKDRQKFSSQFLFTDDLTLVSYIPKPRKCVILLSSLHREHYILGPEQNFKPDIIRFYNNTKNGVDALDKIVREYSSREWTLATISILILFRYSGIQCVI